MVKKLSGDPIIDSWIIEEINDTAQDLETTMKSIVNVVSGNLRDSITTEEHGHDRTVGVDVDLLNRKNGDGFDYSIPYYYTNARGYNGGHKFLEEAMNRVSK